jgi:uroporphyrinogen decarboxylase
VTPRDRVLAALRHQEPDRVPIDFGGTVDTTIQAVAYRKLREHLGLGPGTTRVIDVYQQVAGVDEDVCDVFGVDVRPVFYGPREWTEGSLTDGSPALFPVRFQPQTQPDGSRALLNSDGRVVARMPAGGHYFDPVYAPLADATGIEDIEGCRADIQNYDIPAFLDRTYEELAEAAVELREATDFAVVGHFSGHLLQAGLILRGWEAFYMDLLDNQAFARALMDRMLEANINLFERYAATVGPYLDVVAFEEDLGMQDRPIVSPEIYRQIIKPYQAELFRFVKSRCDAYVYFHSDGAIAPLIPDLIEMGVDILNPVQVSAQGMDTKTLKREFGKDITFWGAGCESQSILPFGTPEQVVDEAKRRIDDLAPGGGFVFSTIHNVQSGVPPENVAAMFNTALSHGVYRG